MTPARLLLVLKSRWRLVLAVWLGLLGVVAAITALQPPGYTATAIVLVDVKGADPLAQTPGQSLQADAYMAAQVDIIQSERVARQVITSMGLAGQPGDAQHRRWVEATDGQGDYLSWLVEDMRRKLDIRPTKESGVMRVSYTAPDREQAARMANAYVQAYADVALQLRVDPARQHSSFFDERQRELRERLEAAQARLSDYQRRNGLVAVGSDERLDIETTRLNELSTQLTQLQGLAGETGSRSVQARANGERAPEVLASPAIAGLNAELARQQARLSELATRLGEQHPTLLELRANIAQLRNQIASETARVTGSLGVSNAVNQSRIAQTQAALDAQRAKVLQLKALRDEAAVLQRDVQQAQAAYDSLGSRITQALLESQSNLSNISVLRSATPPAQMSTRQFGVNLPVAALLGAVLALALAMLRELQDRRLRVAEDVTEAVGLPLLVEIPRGPGARDAGAEPAANGAANGWMRRIGLGGSAARVPMAKC